jgi:hypothetical protein
MIWKLSLGTAALLTAAAISMAGCSGNTESTDTQSATGSTTTITSSVDSQKSDGSTTLESSANIPLTATNLPPGATPSQGARPSMPAIDYAAAASTLGVTEQALKDALVSKDQQPPDFSAAAATLGVTEEALRNALGFKAGSQPGGSPPPNMGTGIPPSITPKSN